MTTATLTTKLRRIRFFVPGVVVGKKPEPRPISKGSMTAYVLRGRSRKQDRAIITDKTVGLKEWQKKIAKYASHYWQGEPTDKPCVVNLDFQFLRPKGHYVGSKSRARPLKSKAPRHHVVKPDKDKCTRSVCDSLTGIVYNDDCQPVDGRITKGYGEPGVWIEITELEK